MGNYSKIKNQDHVSDDSIINNEGNLYRELFENNPAAIAVLDADATISLVNHAFCKLSGYSKDELTGTKWTDKIPVEEYERLKEYNRKRQLGEPDVPNEYETSFFTKERKLRHALFAVSLLKSSKKSVLTFTDITDRKESEEQLRISENRFKSMVEYASDIVFSISKNEIFTYASPNVKEILGYNAAEFIGTSFHLMVHSDDISGLKEAIIQHFTTGKKLTGLEHRVKHKNGSWRWLSTNASPIINTNGEIDLMIGMSRDITDRKIAENALAESEFFFKESQRAANIGSYKVIFLTNLWDSSKVLDEIFGINDDYDRSINPGWFNIIHPADREYMQNYLQYEVIEPQKPFSAEYRIVRQSNGETRWVNGKGNIILGKNGEVESLIGTIQDITERKLSEQAIRDHQLKLDLAFKIARLGSWELDLEQNLFYFNDTFYAIFGTNTQEVGSATMTAEEYAKRFIHPDDFKVVGEEVNKALQTKDAKYTTQIEHRMLYANGEVGYIAVRFAITKDNKGKTNKIFGINQDITAIKLAENELKKSEAELLELNSMKNKFFSIIAHDLRNPLVSIAGLSKILFKDGKLDNDNKELAEAILNSSRKTIDLLSNLMEWTRATSGRMEFSPYKLLLHTIVREVTELLLPAATNKMITINIDVPDNLFVYADLSMLNTILRNLISNAIKFTFTSGSIIISAKEKEDKVLVKVADNGKGILKESLDKIFRIDKNISTLGTENEEGTGLGLILCKEFVEKHNGSIWVESAVGKGCEFYFTLAKPEV